MQKANLTARTIRYYDSEGLLGEVKRSIGYTRYFTDETLDRLEEIKILKKKKYKIEDIKKLFEKKYANKHISNFTGLEVSEVFITESDAKLCQELDIAVIGAHIKFDNNVSITYLKWQELASDAYEMPYQIEHKAASNHAKLALVPDQSIAWPGQYQRSVIHYIRKNHTNKSCTMTSVQASIKRASQWLIVPVDVPVINSQKPEPYFMLYTRSQIETVHNVYRLDDTIATLIKQIKEATHAYNGVMNQVTVHLNPSDNPSNKILAHIKKLVSNSNVIDAEPLNPFLQQQSGTKNAVFISII